MTKPARRVRREEVLEPRVDAPTTRPSTSATSDAALRALRDRALAMKPSRRAGDQRSGSRRETSATICRASRSGSSSLIGHTRHVLAAILTIGNELVSGDTENTNASWLARRLEALGVKVVLSAAVPDEIDRIVEFVRRERAARRPPDRHRRARRHARRHHARGARRRVRRAAGGRPRARGRPALALHAATPSTSRAGRRCPRGSQPLENPLGGAPGFRIANIWVLPGLPSEMKAMFDRYADELARRPPIGPGAAATRRASR